MKDQAEVCPLLRGMMLQSLFPPLQKDIRFFRPLLPAVPLAYLAAAYRVSEDIGFTVFRSDTGMG